MARGLSVPDAKRLADRLVKHDRDHDGLRCCLECRHLHGAAPHAWRCAAWRYAGIAVRSSWFRVSYRCPGASSASWPMPWAAASCPGASSAPWPTPCPAPTLFEAVPAVALLPPFALPDPDPLDDEPGPPELAPGPPLDPDPPEAPPPPLPLPLPPPLPLPLPLPPCANADAAASVLSAIPIKEARVILLVSSMVFSWKGW